jgi:sugar phosphate isomerase/epimerase
LNWITSPWPPELAAIREEQWQAGIEAWQDLATFAVGVGVERIAMELHPLNLVYNVPTLLRMRNAVGPVIGANLDPSHLFWQGMDPLRVARALHAAVYHVHLKDAEIHEPEVALSGVLDPRPWSDPSHRSWSFRTVGHGHPATFWADFFEALEGAGFDGALSIENEDPLLPGRMGVTEAVAFVRPRLGPERDRAAIA